jgi:hypothetical protein
MKHKTVHKILLVIWLVLAYHTWINRDSIAWVTFMSYYAILAAHWAALEASD